MDEFLIGAAFGGYAILIFGLAVIVLSEWAVIDG